MYRIIDEGKEIDITHHTLLKSEERLQTEISKIQSLKLDLDSEKSKALSAKEKFSSIKASLETTKDKNRLLALETDQKVHQKVSLEKEKVETQKIIDRVAEKNKNIEKELAVSNKKYTENVTKLTNEMDILLQKNNGFKDSLQERGTVLTHLEDDIEANKVNKCTREITLLEYEL